LGYVLAGKTGVSLESDLPWNGLSKNPKILNPKLLQGIEELSS
jgi:hypothetical protein